MNEIAKLRENGTSWISGVGRLKSRKAGLSLWAIHAAWVRGAGLGLVFHEVFTKLAKLRRNGEMHAKWA